jgi:hypothetical protein
MITAEAIWIQIVKLQKDLKFKREHTGVHSQYYTSDGEDIEFNLNGKIFVVGYSHETEDGEDYAQADYLGCFFHIYEKNTTEENIDELDLEEEVSLDLEALSKEIEETFNKKVKNFKDLLS